MFCIKTGLGKEDAECRTLSTSYALQVPAEMARLATVLGNPSIQL
jgi:hypothetical protein